MNILRAISLIFILCMAGYTSAAVEISSLDFKKTKSTGKLLIKYKGNLKDYPELKVLGKSIFVHIPNSKVVKTINKAVSFSTTKRDTTLKAFQTNSKDSKIKALFPFNIQKRQKDVALTIRGNTIELTFPRQMVALKAAPKAAGIIKKKVKKEFLNEAYLNSLLKVDKKNKVAKKSQKLAPVKSKDSVKLSQSAPLSKPKQSVSLMQYGGKLVAVLGVVLFLFYGVVALMKKGFIKKGKLGFLNNTDQVMVLGQTFIAPKKSLMLIKAHKQVFLVSNTDSGIHPISEIKDVAGLLKEGEISISGQNFDTNLKVANNDHGVSSKIKLKDDITKSNKQSSLASYTEVKEKVKFSDQIKKKVKGLKPLH